MKKDKVNEVNTIQSGIQGRTAFYFKLPLFLYVFFVPLIVWIYTKNITAGGIATCMVCVMFLITFGFYSYSKRRYLQELVEFAVDYTQVQKRLIKDLELPYGLLDQSGRILWENAAMNQLIPDAGFKSVYGIFEELHEDMLEFTEESSLRSYQISYDGRFYRVEFSKVAIDDKFSNDAEVSAYINDASKKSEELDGSEEVNKIEKRSEKEEYLIAMYLFDETEVRRLAKENVDQKLVAGLIYLDNYEDALESVEEVRRSLLIALIDRKINKYFSTYNGVVKKLEKDKYFVIIKQKYISALQSNKFSILDEVKAVNIGNEMAMTISMGWGVNGEEYTQNCDYSRVAIDLALGRGGDQAVVKDGEKIYFYGGKSKQVEKNTRVKARVKAHALREVLETKDKIIIMGHKIGDIDSFGSAIGIYLAAKSINKRSYIVINEVTTSIRPMLMQFQESDDYEDDLFINSEQAIELVDNNTAVVVVDVNRPSYVECPEILGKAKSIVVLDHHRQSSEAIENAALSYVEPYASSASEMVAEILQYFTDGIKIRPLEADAMYAGIMIDTNNFAKKTGVRTFEAAAFLRKCGTDVTRVRQLFRDTMDDYRARAEAIRTAEVFCDEFALAVCPSAGLDSPTVVGAQAADELLNINGIKGAFVLTEHHNKIYVSARSIGDLNVQLIMERLGGGGHMDTAGAQLEDVSISEAKGVVQNIVELMRAEGEI